MKSRMSRVLTWTTAMILFTALATPIRPSPQELPVDKPGYRVHYTVTELGRLGGSFSFVYGINNKGVVQGFSTLPGDTAVHAFLWQNGLMQALGTLAGPNSQAFFGPNERGQAVGLAETSTPDPNGEDFCGLGTHLICLPFLWQDGVMSPLRTLGGNNGQADDIDNRGEAVGWAETATRDRRYLARHAFFSKLLA